MATTKRDYYDVLGIGRSATEDEIRKAYRRLALQYHPDRNKGAGAADQFKEVKEAYECLSDGEKRALYDRFGHAASDRGFTNGGVGGVSGGFGIEDIFESFFGAQAGTAGRRRNRDQRGADLRTDVTPTLEEAVFGVEKEITFPKHESCARCTGKGIEPGKEPVTCTRCNGSGELRRTHQSIFGQMVNVSMCDRCRGEGTLIQDPCVECRGQGVVRVTRTLRVSIPPASTTTRRSASPLKASRARTVGRPATCTCSCTSSHTATSSARAMSFWWSYRSTWPRPRLATS